MGTPDREQNCHYFHFENLDVTGFVIQIGMSFLVRNITLLNPEPSDLVGVFERGETSKVFSSIYKRKI